MPADDDERPSLEAPQLFGRRRAARKKADPAGPDDDTAVFDDTGTDVPVPARDDDTAVLAAEQTTEQTAVTTTARGRRRRLGSAPPVDGVTDDDPDTDKVADDTPASPAARARLAVPTLEPRVAAALCGALAGLALVVLVWLGFRGCEALRGTTSCGTAPGMLALTTIFALTVVVGALLLRAVRLPEPGACSFLGVGVTAVIALVVLIDALDHWSMVLVIPAVTAVTFVGSWWLTTTYIDPAAD